MQDEIFIDHEGQHRYHPPSTHGLRSPASNEPNTGHKPAKQTSKSLPALQTVVQLNIYRDMDGRFEYLLLRRIDHEAQFWQVVTEPVASGSTIADALREAVAEQVGVRGFRHLSHETYSYEWYAGDERGRDIVFAAEVSPQAVIRLDEGRYNAYAWLPAAEAVQRLKWNGNKQALRQLDEHLRSKRLADVAIQAVVASPAAASSPSAGPDNDAARGPYGGNVPKRLPDRPEDGVDDLRPYPDDDEEDRTGEWFL